VPDHLDQVAEAGDRDVGEHAAVEHGPGPRVDDPVILRRAQVLDRVGFSG
jgi:hypothetical protein